VEVGIAASRLEQIVNCQHELLRQAEKNAGK
jgi:hypothetical protein